MYSKTIVITGVSRGLGAALTHEFIRLGHRITGCGRSPDAIGNLNRLYGPHFEVLDVTDDEAVQRWAAQYLAAMGAPDLLLNNAALVNHNAPLWEIPADEFDAVIDVNIKGVSNMIRHFVPAMVKRRSGVIVNFSSGWGRSTDAYVAPYCASKWAMEGLSKSLAQELPAGMAAIPLNPGIINTDMLRSSFGAQAEHYPDADIWAKTAAPWLIRLCARHNGLSLTVGDAC